MDRRYLIAGLFFAAAAIIAIVLAYPKYQVMQLSSQLVADKQNEFTAQNVLVQEISKLKSQQKQMMDEIADVADFLPVFTAKSVPDLFVELEASAAENGLLMDTVNFSMQKAQPPGAQGKTASAELHKMITAELKMKGEYRDIKNFAKTIETNKHLMDIVTATISAQVVSAHDTAKGENAPQDTSKNVPAYAITIRAYYQ